MIVLLEGVDGSGKSTLAGRLSDLLNVSVYKPESSPMEGMDVLTSQMIDAAVWLFVKQVKPDVIFDRGFPSEWVYGNAYGRDYDQILVSVLDAQAAKMGAVGVLLRFSDPWAPGKRADDHVKTWEEFDRLDELYLEYVSRSKMKWKVINAELPKPAIVREAVRFVQENN